MAEPVSVISTVAAAISAVGGAFAAVAAFRSAASAQAARDAADKAEKRAALRQLRLAANEVLVEAQRAESRAAEAKLAYRTLFTFSGSHSSSREGLYLAEVDKKLGEIKRLSDSAKPFALAQEALLNGPLEEISSRETTISQTLTQVRAIREDLEREHASVEAQNAVHREAVINMTRTR